MKILIFTGYETILNCISIYLSVPALYFKFNAKTVQKFLVNIVLMQRYSKPAKCANVNIKWNHVNDNILINCVWYILVGVQKCSLEFYIE